MRACPMSCTLLPPGKALDPAEVVRVCEHVHLDPLPRVVPTARAFVAEQCRDITPEQRHVVILLTSELVTNAVIHARTRMIVGITLTDHYVLVTVHDEDLGRTELPGPDRHGGRGLMLVQALADASDVEHHPGDGKTSWFRLARAAA